MTAAIQQRHLCELKSAETRGDLAGANLWDALRTEATAMATEEPILGSFLHATVLNHDSFATALSYHLANKMDSSVAPAMQVREVIEEALLADPAIIQAAEIDIMATFNRDPACDRYSTPFLYFKGYHALQSHRIAHWLWQQGRRSLASFFQSRISASFGVDIHPAAQMGCGIMLDHATGIVIGETAVVEDDVSILHAVTLGGTGKKGGDRHPKIRRGVLLAAGCKIIGNIEVGEGAKVGAGSVVLEPVPPHVTVVGVPARIVGRPSSEQPALLMDQGLDLHLPDSEFAGGDH